MAYSNFLGEFTVTQSADWPNSITYTERRPYTGPGFNPWETERRRRVWVQEQAAWAEIHPMQKEYRSIEKRMLNDISIFNSHVRELERVIKKKTGLGIVGTTVSLIGALASMWVPGLGWFVAAFTIISMAIKMMEDIRKKKRVLFLLKIAEGARQRLVTDQARLRTIMKRSKDLLDSVELAEAEVAAILWRDKANQRVLERQKAAQEQAAVDSRKAELAIIRQRTPYRIQYASDL